MKEQSPQPRLSHIETMWTMVGEAHRLGSLRDRDDARVALIHRYQGAAYRYLLGAVRDPDVADELFQEFALQVMQGAFHGADRQRGRFRDYLKTALVHLVHGYHRRQRKLPRAIDVENLAPAVQPGEVAASEERFLDSWRDDLQGRAWAALEAAEHEGGQPFHSVLLFRARNPEASTAEMAARLTEQLRPTEPFSETGIRKTLQRARAKFADALIEEVVQSLDHPTDDQLEQELIDLGLLSYCRSAMRRRREGKQ